MAKIETRDAQGRVNGWLCPIWNVLDGPPVDQVYLTVVNPGSVKGPHLHLRRRGLFKVIRGSVLLVWRWPESVYHQLELDVTKDACVVFAGVPAALYNFGPTEAYVLNMPSPAWRPDDQDEHEVLNWDYQICEDLTSA